MNNSIKLLVSKDDNGKRLDIFLSKKIDTFTRSFIKKLIELENVKVNDKSIISPSTKIRTGDKIDFKSIVINEKKNKSIKNKFEYYLRR